MKSNIKAHASIKLHASISKVWDALTKPEIIKKYFFGTDSITDWKPGSPIRFKGEWKGQPESHAVAQGLLDQAAVRERVIHLRSVDSEKGSIDQSLPVRARR